MGGSVTDSGLPTSHALRRPHHNIVLAAPRIKLAALRKLLSAQRALCQPSRVWQETFVQHKVQIFFKCFGIFKGEKIFFSKTAQNCLKIILEQ